MTSAVVSSELGGEWEDGESKDLGIFVKEMAFGQKGGREGTPLRGDEPYLLAPTICEYFCIHSLECFSFH